MTLSISWQKDSEYWAAYQVQIEGQQFKFEGTDLIDSISELAQATISAVLENQESEAAFENEPGQHILGFQPLGDGRVRLSLKWLEDPYQMFGSNSRSKVLFEATVGNQEALSAVRTLLQQVKEDCNGSSSTLQDCKFPEEAYEILRSA